MNYLKVVLFLLFAGCISESEVSESVPENAYQINPLLIGETVPNLQVTNLSGEDLLLHDVISGTPSVIVFYRGGWCPFCTTHLSDLVRYEEEIYGLGYQILGISPDQPEFLRESIDQYDFQYTLLSDSSMELTRAFGLAYREDDVVVKQLKEGGMDIVESSGYKHKQLPVPAVYITDGEGKVLFQYVNPEYRERINGDILMTALNVFATQ